jgi:oligopeptide transport system permease protein
MLSYFLRRLLFAAPTLWVIVTVCFFLMRLAPGGPFDAQAPVPPEILANLRARYHLDQPLTMQYVDYLTHMVRGDFGPSFKYKDFTVTALIAQGLPVSAQNGLAALALAILVGVPAGILAALRRNSATGHVIMGAAMTGIVVPSFVVAQLAILIFGVWLKDTALHLPAGTWNGGALPNRILPAVCLALPFIAAIARIMRASMIEALRANHIRTARAKGLPYRVVVLRHALQTALMPVVTYLGPATAFLITGSMVIETVFQLPGIGRYFVQGALNRDYTLVMGVTVLSAALIILANLAVDMIYGLIDPRVRYE